MSQNSGMCPSFSRAFVPGLVLGLIVGGVVGAVLTPILTESASLKTNAVPGGATLPISEERSTPPITKPAVPFPGDASPGAPKGDAPATPVEGKPATIPATPIEPMPEPAADPGTAPGQPAPADTPK